MPSKRWALYVRASTNMQTSGLEAQVSALTEFCKKNNITNYEIFSDENYSGAKKSRPALDRMMLAVESDEIEAVCVFSFSRFARSTTHLLSALEAFRKKGIKFHSLTEKIDTDSPMGRALFSILASISQLERELIVERVRNGLRHARLKGKKIGRPKTRNSALIRSLLDKQLPYRLIAELAECSHGSIYSEQRAIKQEKQVELREKNLSKE